MEGDQRSDEIELFNNLNINHDLTETDIDNIDVKSQLEVQIQETKDSGWIFDRINSMKTSFFKTGELSGSSYVKIPLKSNAILNFKNDDKYCFNLVLAYVSLSLFTSL